VPPQGERSGRRSNDELGHTSTDHGQYELSEQLGVTRETSDDVAPPPPGGACSGRTLGGHARASGARVKGCTAVPKGCEADEGGEAPLMRVQPVLGGGDITGGRERAQRARKVSEANSDRREPQEGAQPLQIPLLSLF
jgi:hypothetical protein